MNGSQTTDNVVELLRDVAQRSPDRLALAMGGAEDDAVTFGVLWERVCRISTALRNSGLAAGDRVVLMIPMSIDLYAVMLAIIKAGGVAVFVDPWVSVGTIARFAAFADPRGFAGVPRSHVLRFLQSSLRRLPITMTTGARFGPFPARLSLAECLEAPPDATIIQPASADASALITFTSGSSGIPKGANRTHAFLQAQYEALCAEFAYGDDDVDMPMFPVFALRNLAGGVSSVIPDMDFRHVSEVDGAAILAQIRTYGVTTCTASPPFVTRLCQAIQDDPGTPSGLRRILTGGAPVDNAMLRRWREVLPDAAVEIVYGSTEAEPVASISLEERLAAKSAQGGYCVGCPIDRVRTRVIQIHRGPVGPHDWESIGVAPGQVGELIVSGDHVCRDYFRNPEAVADNKIVDADGRLWHRMGDTGYVDADGRFWLVGRLHSTILRDGVAWHAQLVEQAAGEILPKGRVAALGMPDVALGEALVLVVEESDPGNVASGMRDAGVPVDDVVCWSGPLPMDPRHNSKIDYALLREKLNRRDWRRR